MSNPGFEAPLSHATEWSRPYSFLPAIEAVFAPQLYSGQAPSQSQEDSGIRSRERSSHSSSSNSATAVFFVDRRHRADDAAVVAGETAEEEEAETEAAAGTGLDSSGPQQPSLSDYGGGSGGGGAGSSPPHPYAGDAGFLGLRHAHSPARQPHQQSPLDEPLGPAESCYASRNSHDQAADLYEQTAGDSGMVVLPLPEPERGGSCADEAHAGLEGLDEDGEDDEDDEEETACGAGSGSGGDAEDGEAVSAAQTTSERMAQRRKMKRFRLTHQQTRFLMSEFSKQPHPDAAHRECLSREIPGLSPRQVQVWFQNRRAKIKRLAADDRERVIKMRAVPDDFDNVQALHSPYGAVHGLGAPPLASPVDYAASSYGEHPGQQHYSQPQTQPQPPPPPPQQQHQPISLAAPPGLGPAFALGPAFPLAPAPAPGAHGHASARFGRVPTVPSSTPASSSSSSMSSLSSLSSSASSSNSSSSGGGVAVDSDPRSRPLQPLQPLRPSMAWKGDVFNYSALAGGRGMQQPPTPTHELPFVPFLPSAVAVVTTSYDGSTAAAAAVRTPSFWELQQQR